MTGCTTDTPFPLKQRRVACFPRSCMYREMEVFRQL